MNVDPNSSNGNNPKGNKPSNDARVDITVTPLDELMPPPRSAAGQRVRDLFTVATAKAYAEIGEILYATESRPLRSYIGYRTAVQLSPKSVPLAMDILKLHSLHATQEFLTILAQREYAAFMLGASPTLKGDTFSELRVQIAELAVSPECFFAPKDWERDTGEILGLTRYPITILRMSAGREVDRILIAAATRGGLDGETNRRALDLLLLREESAPRQRVLSSDDMKAISRATDDLLREPFNRMQLVQLLDVWLSKEQNLACDTTQEIRDRLITQWLEYRDSGWSPTASEEPKVFDTIRLLRFFDDPLSRLALSEAAAHSHIGVSLLARLCQNGGSVEDLAAISSALDGQATIANSLMALQVFGYRISSQVDVKLWPLFNDYISRAWGSNVSNNASQSGDIAQRLVVLRGVVRRFYSERFDSPFLERIFSTVGSDNKAMAAVAVNTLVQVSKIDRIPPPTFYDHPEKFGPLQAAIQILYRAGQDNAKDVAVQLAQGIQELFILKGPAAYGFELAESDESAPAA